MAFKPRAPDRRFRRTIVIDQASVWNQAIMLCDESWRARLTAEIGVAKALADSKRGDTDAVIFAWNSALAI